MGEDEHGPECDPEWQRRFGRAHTAARRLCGGLVRSDPRDRFYDVPAETAERYRQLFINMGLARRSPGGDAIAALARRGYVIMLRRAVPGGGGVPLVAAINQPGIVRFGGGMPTRYRPWKAAEQAALALDVTAYPPLRFVSAHEALSIQQQLRRGGHDLGW